MKPIPIWPANLPFSIEKPMLNVHNFNLTTQNIPDQSALSDSANKIRPEGNKTTDYISYIAD